MGSFIVFLHLFVFVNLRVFWRGGTGQLMNQQLWRLVRLKFDVPLSSIQRHATKTQSVIVSEQLAAGCRDNRWEFRTGPLWRHCRRTARHVQSSIEVVINSWLPIHRTISLYKQNNMISFVKRRFFSKNVNIDLVWNVTPTPAQNSVVRSSASEASWALKFYPLNVSHTGLPKLEFLLEKRQAGRNLTPLESYYFRQNVSCVRACPSKERSGCNLW